MDTTLQRMQLLVGNNGLETLRNATVLVVGIGGVGSYSAEALARSGVGNIVLVDGDVIALSNLNRQIHAIYATVDLPKPQVMKERILSFHKECNVICHSLFYDASKNDILFSQPVDFVIDAIDTISSKIDLVTYCSEHNIPIISSMGMANRMDPTCVSICELMKTSYDPLAKIMRSLIRKKGLRIKLPVVYSSEHPSVQTKIINEDGNTRKEKMPPASSPFVPAAAGLAAASYVIRELIKQE